MSAKQRWEIHPIDPSGRPHATRIFDSRSEAESLARAMRRERPGWRYEVRPFPDPSSVASVYRIEAGEIARRMAEDANSLYEVALRMHGDDVITNGQLKRADQIAAAIVTELQDFGTEVLTGAAVSPGRRRR